MRLLRSLRCAAARRVLLALVRRCTEPDALLPPFYFDDRTGAFFFGEPVKVFGRIWDWFATGDIYAHLG